MSAEKRHDAVSNRLQVLLLAAVVFAPGCSVFSMPKMKMPTMGDSMLGDFASGVLTPEEPPENAYVPVGENVTLQSGTFTQDVYQAVRKAKATNSIVLQVVGDDEPIRILPLPSADEGSAPGSLSSGIFLSTLLKQTGIVKKLGRIQAALYRPSPASFEGIRMDIQFAEREMGQIRPESDYALRPGDRIIIRRDNRMGLDSIVDLALGR